MKKQMYLLSVILMSLFLLFSCNSQKRVIDSDEYAAHSRKNYEMKNTTGPFTVFVTQLDQFKEENGESYYAVGLGVSARYYYLYSHTPKYKRIAGVLRYSRKTREFIKVYIRQNDKGKYEIFDAMKVEK